MIDKECLECLRYLNSCNGVEDRGRDNITIENSCSGFLDESIAYVSKRDESQKILMSKKSDDLKLYQIFDLYKEDLHREYSQLYYALLAWKDTHLKELHKEQSSLKN